MPFGLCARRGAILVLTVLAGGTLALGQEEQGLVARWTFDEAPTGRIEDRSGNGNAIALHAPLATYRIQQVACEKGKALLFREHPLWGTFRTAGGPATSFSVAAWVHPLAFASESNSYRNILTVKSDGNEQVFRFTVRGNGALYVQIPGIWDISPWGGLQANLWQHVGFSYDQKVVRIYLNGKEVSSRKVEGDTVTSLPETGRLQLGGAQRGFAWSRQPGADVGLDDCRLYRRALRPERFAALHRAGKDAYAVTEPRTWPDELKTLSIVSYNVLQYHGRYIRGRAPADAPDFRDGGEPRGDRITFYGKTLASLEGDVYALQEAAYPPISKALAEKLSCRTVPQTFDPKAYRAGKHMTAGAILSRYPIVDVRDYPRFRLDGARAETRIFFRTVLEVPGVGKVMVYNVHLWPYGPDSGLIEQEGILRILDRERQLGVPQLLVGDFNRRADSFFLELLARHGWRNVVKEAGAQEPGSWNVDNQYAHIDWILLRGADDWTLESCEVVRNTWTAGTDTEAFVASDHLPVRAIFSGPQSAKE